MALIFRLVLLLFTMYMVYISVYAIYAGGCLLYYSDQGADNVKIGWFIIIAGLTSAIFWATVGYAWTRLLLGYK